MANYFIFMLCCVPRRVYGLHFGGTDPGSEDAIVRQFSTYDDGCLPQDRIMKSKDIYEPTNESLISLQPIKGPSTGTASNIVLYMTTHLSPQHMSFLNCWPSKVLNKSKMLAQTDVIVQTFGSVTPDVRSSLAAFPNKIVRLADLGRNVGYQEPAMKAVAEAFRNGWMTSYEWMIRVNPDVIIWSEAPLMDAMKSNGAWGVFANCNINPNVLEIHTDFFAVRPKRISCTAFSNWGPTAGSAEHQATGEFRFIVDGKHAFMLIEKNNGCCRVRGAGMWHDQGDCEDVFQRKPWLDDQVMRAAN